MRGQGAPAEGSVAGVMKHRLSHQTSGCHEEKPWLLVGGMDDPITS